MKPSQHIKIFLASLSGASFALLSACHTPMPADDAAAAATKAAGLRAAIIFQTNSAPIDLAASTNSLALPDAVQQAVLASPEIQMALARARAAQADAWQTRVLPNPVLHILFRLPEGGGATAIEAGLATELAHWIQQPRRIRAADHRLRAAGATVVTAALDVIAETETHYLAHVAHQETIALLQQRQSVLAALREVAQRRLDSGEGTRLDVAAMDAQLAEVLAELAEQRMKLAIEKLALARLLGQPSVLHDFQLSTPLSDPAPVPSEAAWISNALQRRPEIQSARAELAARGDDQALARLAWLSGLGAGLAAERDPDWSLGPSVTVPLPIFDTGAAARAKAEAELIEVRHHLTQLLRRAVQEVRQAHIAQSQLQAAANHVRERLIPLQQERARLARAVHAVGQSDITPVRLAELDLQAAQLRLLDLRRRLATAASQLRRAGGGPLSSPQP